jgi:hypothetical protein
LEKEKEKIPEGERENHEGAGGKENVKEGEGAVLASYQTFPLEINSTRTG